MSEEFNKEDYSEFTLSEQRVIELVGMIKVLNEDIRNNPTFQLEDHELVQEKMVELIEQLRFWEDRQNDERFCDELASHIKWFLNTFANEDE